MYKKVLIIDDDIQTCKKIKYNLQNEDTNVYYALSVQDALQKLMSRNYELVIMDVYLSEMNGMDLLSVMRQMKPMPILVMSTKGSIEEKVKALTIGADDYITKPFVTEECLARSQALIRRFTELNTIMQRRYIMVTCEDLIVNKEHRQVFLKGKRLSLTRKEFDMLNLLVSHPEIVFTFEQLYENIWNDEYINAKNSVVCQVRRLRKKLNDHYIESVRDVGYRFRSRRSNMT